MIIGVTGISGSGKTTTARYLSEHYNAEYVSLDALGHHILAENYLVRCVAKLLFGTTERPIIARQVFSSPWKLLLWNAVMHPLIRRLVQRKIRDKTKSFVLDGALLYQMSLHKYCNEVIFLDAPEELLQRRLLAEGLSPAQALRRLAANQKVYIYKELADVLIINNGSLIALQKKIENICR